jgi:hypothetical protein
MFVNFHRRTKAILYQSPFIDAFYFSIVLRKWILMKSNKEVSVSVEWHGWTLTYTSIKNVFKSTVKYWSAISAGRCFRNWFFST